MTHCPTRSTSRLARPSSLVVNRSTAIPGRPSGVSAAGTARSMPASHLHPITDVAKPVIERAAASAHFSFSAVMSTRAPHIANASANVSTITTSSISISHRGGKRGPRSSCPPLARRGGSLGRGRDQLVLPEIGVGDSVVVEADGVVVLEERPDQLLDSRIVIGGDVQHSPLVVLDDQLPILDDIPRRAEHPLLVVVLVVDRDVGVRTRPEMPLVREAQQPRWTGASDDRDLVEGVLAVEPVGERRLGERLRIDLAHFLAPKF